ncbi:hypothetical protein ACHAWF_018722 [Thalassiosira exigua]
MLSSDPLTSSTVDITPFKSKDTTFDAVAKAGGKTSKKERLRRLAEEMDSEEDDDDDDLDEAEFLRAVAARKERIREEEEKERRRQRRPKPPQPQKPRRTRDDSPPTPRRRDESPGMDDSFLRDAARARAEREARLAESQDESRARHRSQVRRPPQPPPRDESFRRDESARAHRRDRSREPHQRQRSFDDSSARSASIETQRQDRSRRQGQQPSDRRQDSFDSFGRGDSSACDRRAHESTNDATMMNESFAETQAWERELDRSALANASARDAPPHPRGEEGRLPESLPVAPRGDSCNGQERGAGHRRAASDGSPGRAWDGPRADRDREQADRGSAAANQHGRGREPTDAGAATNPYRREQPVGNPYRERQHQQQQRNAPAAAAKRAPTHVPKISLEHLRSARKGIRGTGGSGDPGGGSGGGEGEASWQEDAFRSSLLDLLGSFPPDRAEGDAEDEGEGTVDMIDDDTPRSTASQAAASCQTRRRRLFDAASRALARLAVASRRPRKQRRRDGRGDRTDRSSDRESPDFEPPSPRSLPSYVSVTSARDEGDGRWGGGSAWGASAPSSSSSRETFSGGSVHGRSARTVRLSSIAPTGGNASNSVQPSSPFSLWTTEELAVGAAIRAARVCAEASRDPNFEADRPPGGAGEAEGSCRVAGFARSSTVGGAGRGSQNGGKPAVQAALVEAVLGYLATAFACLEADLVHAALKSPLGNSDATVFDAVVHFAPASSSGDASAPGGGIPTLAVLALSRGLDAALYVARYAASLDPSSACAAYSSPHHTCGRYPDAGIDEGGVGWRSALGRDLGLKLEDGLGGRPKHARLTGVAEYAYNFVLEYDPTIVGDASDVPPGSSRSNDRNGEKRGNSRGGLYVDTQLDQGCGQGVDGFACRQPSVLRDRIYSAHASYLSSMIQAGLVSGWLSRGPVLEGEEAAGSAEACTAERLCQKLFFVVETRSRPRPGASDPGDSEAVCAASLSLLVLALPGHTGRPSRPSFRHMGDSTGTVEDLFQSPLGKRLVDIGLSWQDPLQGNQKDAETKHHATCNALYVLADVCMAGGSSLIASGQFLDRANGFLQTIAKCICKRGKSGAKYDVNNSTVDSALLFIIHLHTGSPLLVRKFLRDFLEESSDQEDCASYYFVRGLLHLSVEKSLSVSSCASALLRILIEGNPVDQTQDRLSEIILASLDAENVSSTLEAVLRSLMEVVYSSVNCSAPNFCIRWQSRLCSLGDLLSVCTSSIAVVEIMAASLSDEVLSLIVHSIEDHLQNNLSVDTLGGSATLSLLFVLASFVKRSTTTLSEQDRASILVQQRNVREKLRGGSIVGLAVESGLAQGASADMTYRALKLQNSVMSLGDVHSLALSLTKSNNSVARKEVILRGKLEKSENELKEMTASRLRLQVERDSLISSLDDQRLAYERRIEWTRSEARMAARNISDLHVEERKKTEEQFSEENKMRLRVENENEHLKRDSLNNTARIKELEELLEQERKSRQGFESAYHECEKELSVKIEELERTSKSCHDLQERLAVTETKVSDLTESHADAAASLEVTSSKLVRLSTIYQMKESEMEKHKAELRSAVKAANKDADTALKKYEHAKQQNKSLSAELKEAKAELKEIKAHRAEIQRMRKNAPTAYLNQLHNDPRIQGKKRGGWGKENSFHGR